MIKEVSDLTRFDFDKCWELDIYMFFNYLAFSKDRAQKREEMLKKEMAKYKMK